MITQEDIVRSREALEKLAYAGIGSALWAGTKATGKGIAEILSKAGGGIGKFLGEQGKTLAAAAKMPAEGKLGVGITGLAALGLGASLVPYGEDALDKVPVLGAGAKFLNPYGNYMISPEARMAGRYKMLDPDVEKKVEKGGVGSLSRLLANQPRRDIISRHTKTGSSMISKEEIAEYYRLKKRLEKTASVRSLKRIVSGAGRDGKGSFARQALAYMAGATALGVAAPLAAEAVGSGMNFARKGRLNRDYKNVLDVDPELKQEPDAKKYFEVLHRASPYVATEPVIAATVVRNLVDSPGLDSRKFQEILELEKMRQHTRHPMLRDPSGISNMMSMSKMDSF